MSETLSSIIAKDIQDGCQHRFTSALPQSDTSPPGFYVEMARVVRAELDGANTLLLQIDRTGNFMIGVSPNDKDYAMVHSVFDWLNAWAIVDDRLKLSPLHLAE